MIGNFTIAIRYRVFFQMKMAEEKYFSGFTRSSLVKGALNNFQNFDKIMQVYVPKTDGTVEHTL